MLKYLALIGLFGWFVCGARSQVPGDGGKHDRPTQAEQYQTQPVKQRTAAVQIQERAPKEADDTKQKSANYPWHELLAPANIPNWFLVLVGFWAGMMALKTLRAIEHQTHYARIATESSFNKDRARLFLQHTLSKDFCVTFTATNRGQSPALVTYCFVGCEIFHNEAAATSEKERFSEVPDYIGDHSDATELVRSDWVVKGTSVRVGWYDANYIDRAENPELYEEVFHGRYTVWFYGIVRYTDHLVPDEHELRFCYRCYVFDGEASHLIEDGPAAYRCNT